MGLFSKKPGGTFFGNLLRGVSSSLTGGALGQGLNRIEVGETKTNKELMKENDVKMKEMQTMPSLGSSASNPIVLPEVTVSASKVKPFDLNDYIKLPTVNTEVSANNNMYFFLGAFGLLMFFMMGSRRRI